MAMTVAADAMPQVDTLMAGELSTWLDSQTEVRRKAKADGRFRMLCGGAGALVIGFVTLLDLLPSQIGQAGAALAFAAGWSWARKATRPVEQAIKAQMNSRIASALGLSFTNEGPAGGAFNTAKSFALLPSYDNMRVEDFWTGILGGVAFTLHEATLTERRQSGKQRRNVTVFHGVIMAVEFARPFGSTVVIERSGSWGDWFGRDTATRGGVKLEEMRMVDPRIDDAFKLWTNDPVEARYLIHPAYAERLLDLEAKFSGQQLRAVFYDGQITIAIQTAAMFESGSLDADRDRANMDRTIAQIMSLVGVATAMNERPR